MAEMISLLRRTLLGAPSDPHFCQFFEADPRLLAQNAAKFLSAGLALGEPALVIAGPERRAAIFDAMDHDGVGPRGALRDLRLQMLDAREVLDGFLVGGYPDANRFRATVGELTRSLCAAGKRLHAYGEMVGMLWASREYPAAIRLEQLWNSLRKETPFALFCGYPIDVFGDHFQKGTVDALLCAHTHLLPSAESGAIGRAVEKAMQEVLGPNVVDGKTGETKEYPASWAEIPTGESLILWIRSNLPQKASEILTLARRYYQEAPAAS